MPFDKDFIRARNISVFSHGNKPRKMRRILLNKKVITLEIQIVLLELVLILMINNLLDCPLNGWHTGRDFAGAGHRHFQAGVDTEWISH